MVAPLRYVEANVERSTPNIQRPTQIGQSLRFVVIIWGEEMAEEAAGDEEDNAGCST